MEIIVAKTAGFCFGVDRAVKRVERLIEENYSKGMKMPIYTYGPIIHNPHVVRHLEDEGVKVIRSLDELKVIEKGLVLIRSHGVSEAEMKAIEDSGNRIVDSTCPYVKKIHRIVRGDSEAGCEIIIVGNPDHPEIQGIAGWVTTEVHYIENMDDVEKLELDSDRTYSVVAQRPSIINFTKIY